MRVQTLAELLTTDKLSELACLTLYLCYEKKNGKQSVWYEFIKVMVLPIFGGQKAQKGGFLAPFSFIFINAR